MNRKHALVVGGTGMLSDVTLWLHKKGYIVSVIGRRNETYQRLIRKAEKPKLIHSLVLDYHHTDLLKEKLTERIKKDGPFQLVVCWVHSTGKEVIPTILALQKDQKYDFFHVKSSTSYISRVKPDVPENVDYHEIYLGFKLVGNHSRWLTHDEISEGVKDAIHHRRKETIVGQLEPWDKRP
jgi:hypothetical protein